MPLGHDGRASRDGNDIGGERGMVRVDTTVADHVVRGDVRDGLKVESYNVFSRRTGRKARRIAYAIVVGRANTDKLALVHTVDVELLKDGVGRGGPSEDRGGSEGRELRHLVECEREMRGIDMFRYGLRPLYPTAFGRNTHDVEPNPPSIVWPSGSDPYLALCTGTRVSRDMKDNRGVLPRFNRALQLLNV